MAGGSLLIARAPRAGAEPTTTTTEPTTTTVAPTQVDWDDMYATEQFQTGAMLLLFGAGAITGSALWGRSA